MPSCMRTSLSSLLLCFLLLPVAAFSAEKGLLVKGARYFSYAAFTRIVLEIETTAPYVLTRSTDGRSLSLSAYEGPLVVKASLPTVRDGVVSSVEVKEEAGRNYLVVRLDSAAGEAKDFVLRGPDRIVIDINRGTPAASSVAPASRLTVIVLDPGHGGRDQGIVTAQGYEKTLTLELAHAVKRILQKNPQYKVMLTREKDQALSLDERAASSNGANAAVFVSLHAASGAGARAFIHDPLDEAGTPAVQPASGDFLGFEAGSEQREMIWGHQQAVHARQSGELGLKLARSLAAQETGQAVQAPLAGLQAVDTAAALIEFGSEQDRSRIAESIAGGIAQYVRADR